MYHNASINEIQWPIIVRETKILIKESILYPLNGIGLADDAASNARTYLLRESSKGIYVFLINFLILGFEIRGGPTFKIFRKLRKI